MFGHYLMLINTIERQLEKYSLFSVLEQQSEKLCSHLFHQGSERCFEKESG
jgi:hypothetical protein